MPKAILTLPGELICARWIAPMDGPIISDGAVAFRDGIIICVGRATEVHAQCPDARITELPDSILLPGLVNAHVHLELSNLTCGQPPARFVDWLMRLAPRTAPDPQLLQASVKAAVLQGIGQCLHFGVTTVGDISRHAALTRPILRASPLRGISFGEVLAMAQRRTLLAERLAAAADVTDQSPQLAIGISPHAPYSVEARGFRACLASAIQNGFPLSTHLAETPDESNFLARHTGPFRELWEYLGAWDDAVPHFEGGPIRFAQSLGLLDYHTVLAHVNYCDDAELALVAAGRASVVYCPRTHAYFHHPPHRWRDMLAAGINVAVGTDSTASSPDLNLVDDLRLLHRLAPDLPAELLWEMATIRAARALGLENQVGALTSGKAADFVAFKSSGADPLHDVLESSIEPSDVWIGGRSTTP